MLGKVLKQYLTTNPAWKHIKNSFNTRSEWLDLPTLSPIILIVLLSEYQGVSECMWMAEAWSENVLNAFVGE